MKTSSAIGTALLVTTALTAPALAQTSAPNAPAQTSPATEPSASSAAPEEDVEISIPGGASQGDDVVVTGRFIPNVVKATPQVVSVLSAADIARTGEGDIAGALQRVTGLSVVGEGFVYVRGLGDRYSLSLLNGSPLPSPDPLKRVVPLDIFPSSLIASGLVQKSYSPNFPGEYGGGAINLTTQATPKEPFIKVGSSISYDSATTTELGYTYYGSKSDWTGYDSGTRSTPDFVRTAANSGVNIDDPDQVFALSRPRLTVLQLMDDTPANWSADFSAGTTVDVGGSRLGIIGAAGISNSWLTRDALRQTAFYNSGGTVRDSFQTVSTDNRVLVNSLLGLGLETGEHVFRVTGLYIHDTVKQGLLAAGYNTNFGDDVPGAGDPAPRLTQQTAFVERQLIDLQGTAELRFDDLSVDMRGTYANTKRKSPFQYEFRYKYNSTFNDYTNELNNSDQSAELTFGRLSEDLYGGGVDVGYKLPTDLSVKLTAGYAYTDTQRTSSRYFFQYVAGNLSDAEAQLRPDYLLSTDVINDASIELDPQTAGSATEYDAGLRIHAGYAMADIEPVDGLRVSGGVRYETSDQTVQLIGGTSATDISSEYWLPALTVTWNFRENMQLRLHGSKTIARPQFRELAEQEYRDFSSDRRFVGNPQLVDSELFNLEGRFEWFFERDQRLSVAAFYKKIDNPIEPIYFNDPAANNAFVYFGNAPKANLYGAEIEFQKYIPLDTAFPSDFFATRRAVIIANYTYSKSELEVGDELIADPVPSGGARGQVAASTFFSNGVPLTGQSDHLVNLQLGIEDTERLSQLTLLFNYASERVTFRGRQPDPDFIEKPGVRLDVVFRQAIPVGSGEFELKAEARNITGTDYRETQDFGNGNVVQVNSYEQGTVFSLGASVRF